MTRLTLAPRRTARLAGALAVLALATLGPVIPTAAQEYPPPEGPGDVLPTEVAQRPGQAAGQPGAEEQEQPAAEAPGQPAAGPAEQPAAGAVEQPPARPEGIRVAGQQLPVTGADLFRIAGLGALALLLGAILLRLAGNRRRGTDPAG